LSTTRDSIYLSIYTFPPLDTDTSGSQPYLELEARGSQSVLASLTDTRKAPRAGGVGGPGGGLKDVGEGDLVSNNHLLNLSLSAVAKLDPGDSKVAT